MASQGVLFSHTLEDITDTKLADLANYRREFEAKRSAALDAVKQETNPVQALAVLAVGVRKCFNLDTTESPTVPITNGNSNARLLVDLGNLDRFLSQARYDPSISEKILGQWRQRLMKCLSNQSLKYSYASLYGQLTKEWLAEKRSNRKSHSDGDVDMEDFEHLETRQRLECRQNWESKAFSTPDIDPLQIKSTLTSIFEPKGDDFFEQRKAIKQLRSAVLCFQTQLESTVSFTPESLKWTIAGLKASDLLSDEKRAVLRDIESNETFLTEIADVLNMRKTSLSSWSWGPEVKLEERRQVNGSFRIYMDEDLLQAIFLHYLGVKWSVFWKHQLCNLQEEDNVWKASHPHLPADQEALLQEQFGYGPRFESSVQHLRQSIHGEDFFMSQLFDEEEEMVKTEEGQQEAEFDSMTNKMKQDLHAQSAQFVQQRQNIQQMQMAQQLHQMQAAQQLQQMQAAQQMQPAHQLARQPASQAPPGFSGGGGGYRVKSKPPGGGKVFRNQRSLYFRPLKKQRLDDPKGSLIAVDGRSAKKSPMELKQNLLHLVATDIKIKAKCHGDVTCMRTQIAEFYPSLPHQTIKSVLSYFGVSKRWLEFFMKFLAAPLRFPDDGEAKARRRMRGTPGAHVLSEVFGEVVLFCLDFFINNLAGGEILWRVHDDLWFWSSDHQTCVSVWTNLQSFTRVMGLDINLGRTGCVRIASSSEPESGQGPFVSRECDTQLPSGEVRWGMLKLEPRLGGWEIDQEMVDQHIQELSRQLENQKGSIFAWIQVWNAYASTFFTSNFGPPAVCLGKKHVEDMLETHQRIQKDIFGKDLKDSEYRSVSGFLKQTIFDRYGVGDIPDAYIFLPTELGGLEVHSPFIGLLHTRGSLSQDADKLFAEFEAAERIEYQQRKKAWEKALKAPTANQSELLKRRIPFMSFEQFTSYRETQAFGYENELSEVFTTLLEAPRLQSLPCTADGEVASALATLSEGPTRGLLPHWGDMEHYWQWIAQLYGPEMIEQFGGFRFVDPSWLPMGIVSQFRSGRVKWKD